MREPSAVISVSSSVDDDGLVHIEGDDLSLVRWNHRPALLRAALQRFGGRVDWKPAGTSCGPTEVFMGSAQSLSDWQRWTNDEIAASPAPPIRSPDSQGRLRRISCPRG